MALPRSDLLKAQPEAAAIQVLADGIADDEHAIKVFLDSYSRKSTHTMRSYQKECLRFLLWLRASHPLQPAMLPAVTVEHINAYLDFVTSPRPFAPAFLQQHGWTHQPFRKPLGSESVKHCITVLHKLFAALRELPSANNQPYCSFNPVKLAHSGISGSSDPQEEVEEALSDEEWQAVQDAIDALPCESARDLKHYHRARWVMHLLYRAFLRREEAANLTMGSFEASAQGWSIRLVGKGNKKAKIIATNALIAELKRYRESLGLAALPSPGESRPAILAVTGQDKGVTPQAIYLICKEIFARAADLIEEKNVVAATRLRQASPHWMRHTGISHSMEGGVDPRYVQAQARHSSLNVTAKYDHKKRKAWRDSFERASN